MTKKIYFFLFIYFTIINVYSKVVRYRCGADDDYVPSLPATIIDKIDKNDPTYKRRIESEEEEFKDFNIYLDLVNIKNDIKKFGLEQYEDLYINSMNKAIKTLESLLKVKKVSAPFGFSDEQIKKVKIDDWNKTMFGTNATGNMITWGVDLIIMGRFDDQMPESTLASAGPRYTDTKTGRPLFGVVNINTKIDYSKLNSEHAFQATILHEFTHILGFLSSYFEERYHNIFSKVDEDGVLRSYINSTKVLEVARKYFNCPTIDGVELEESGGNGTVRSHWEARILLGDYMNGVSYLEEEVISEFTLALLEDSTFYKANYYTGGLMRYGKGKGCDFVNKKCIISKNVNPLFENEFFSSILSDTYFDASCSSGRLSRAYHYFGLYENIPEYYQYFDGERGGFPSADYCPISLGEYYEGQNIDYVGSCTTMGSGEYGTKIKYITKEIVPLNETHYQIKTFYKYNTSGELLDFTGETFSDQSFCYQSTLIQQGINYNNSIPRAVCYESFCSNRSLTIKIKDDYFVCPRAGGKIEVDGYTGYFLCADYNLICSGTVMCNDLFDCVEKKSETKEESYYYDYTILTSQNLENAEIGLPDNITNYELSDNGICPKDCKQCKINKKCSKCRDGYNLVGSNENEEIICLSQSELNKGYYQENNIYYPCINNCDTCNDGDTCDKCANNFDYVNNKCMKQIENCETYDSNGECSKCKDNYAFKENNRTICLNKDNFDNYYTKDNGISYYPCQNEVESCSKCYYEKDNSEIKCYLCNNEFVLLENECLLESNLNKTFYKINETHINKCSNAINNCNECEDKNTCIKCDNDFYMINNETKNCIDITNIPLDEYYLKNGTTMLYSCNNSNYNDIDNCKKCSDKTSCSLCKDTFTFIDGDKSLCVGIDTLNNKYIKDPNDETNYIKCHNFYNNCDTCNNIKCLSCLDGFNFINDDYSNCIIKSLLPTNAPSQKPTISPTQEPTFSPTQKPTISPTQESTFSPTQKPTISPTQESTFSPTQKPTISPTQEPTNTQTQEPTNTQTQEPTNVPTQEPTNVPTQEPTNTQTQEPTNTQTQESTNVPTQEPTNTPTNNFTNAPINLSTNIPTNTPTTNTEFNSPTSNPTNNPTIIPTYSLTNTPTTNSPTNTPTYSSTNIPTNESTQTSTHIPTDEPINLPSTAPITITTNSPTNTPTNKQTTIPTTISTNTRTNAPTNKPTSAPTTIPTNTPTNAPTIIPTITPTITPIEDESLSYYQINNFDYNKSTKTIKFNLSVLTSEGQIKTNDTINIYVNLIHTNGTRDSLATESECTCQNIESNTGSITGTFLCTINNLKDDYYSLRYNSSANISGVPDDEIDLDPVLTDKYKNKNEKKIIPTFTIESIKHDSCKTSGVFTITGTLSAKLDQSIKFNFPLTYPEGITSSCEFNQEQNEIECKVDREINNKIIVIEQRIIKQGTEDYFNLKSITSKEEITCLNGALQDSIKIENITISFRQVSHFEKSSNGFSFYLIALVSEKLEKGKKITINVNVNDQKEDKPVDCILEDSVAPSKGQTQGNFLCSVDKNKNTEWKDINMNDISVSISPNNDMISGVSDLDETTANPSKTDEKIKNIKEKLSKNETVNALTNVIDYYSDEVEINTLMLNNINMDKCDSKGQLTLTGTFSADIEGSVNFNLPLTYPSAEIKCELKNIKKNIKTDIKCKAQTEIKSIQNIIIEPRLIKKKNQELFYIQGKTFNLTKETSCAKYDTIKKQLIEKRQTTGIFFGFIGKFQMVNKIITFFMALTRKSNQFLFQSSYYFTSKFTFSIRRYLRNLDENTYSDVEITCNLNNSLTLELTGGYNCQSESSNYQGNPTSLEIETDQVEGISGIEKINSPTNSTLHYSNKDNLQKINGLPEVTIDSINGDTCSENGQYNITGTISDVSNLEDIYTNVEITLSSPESTGLCKIEIDKEDKTIIMTCDNRDKFGISQIILDRSLIQDSEGNYIFIINSYTSPEQFSCDISLNSIKTEEVSKETPNPSPSGGMINRKNPSGGLSGGAIAGIVIACVAAVAAVAIVAVLLKNNIISCKKKKEINETINTTNNVVAMNSDTKNL